MRLRTFETLYTVRNIFRLPIIFLNHGHIPLKGNSSKKNYYVAYVPLNFTFFCRKYFFFKVQNSFSERPSFRWDSNIAKL